MPSKENVPAKPFGRFRDQSFPPCAHAETDRVRAVRDGSEILQFIVRVPRVLQSHVVSARNECAGHVDLRLEVAVQPGKIAAVLKARLVHRVRVQDRRLGEHQVLVIAGRGIPHVGKRRRQAVAADPGVFPRVPSVLEAAHQGVVGRQLIIHPGSDRGPCIRRHDGLLDILLRQGRGIQIDRIHQGIVGDLPPHEIDEERRSFVDRAADVPGIHPVRETRPVGAEVEWIA